MEGVPFMSKFKRMISLLLVIVMLVGYMPPLQANAEETDPTFVTEETTTVAGETSAAEQATAYSQETTEPEEATHTQEETTDPLEETNHEEQSVFRGQVAEVLPECVNTYLYFESLYRLSATILKLTNLTKSSNPPCAKIQSTYHPDVSCGTIRYITQVDGYSDLFDWDYWPLEPYGNYKSPGNECGTCCISMALSYIGINRTPKSLIMDYYGTTRDMFSGVDGTTYSSLKVSELSAAVDRYISGNGKYSPVVIHLNYGQSIQADDPGHYIMIIGKTDDGQWEVMDPACDYLTNYTIDGTAIHYLGVDNTIDQVHQWYNPNGGIGYLSTCEKYPSYGQLTVTSAASVMSQPCNAGVSADSQPVGSAAMGSSYTVTALYENDQKEYWYQVLTADAAKPAYIKAANGSFSHLEDDISVNITSVPVTIQKGDPFPIEGEIKSVYNGLNTVSAYVYGGNATAGDAYDGETHKLAIPRYFYSIRGSVVDNGISFGSLDEGSYNLVIRAFFESSYVENGVRRTVETVRQLPYPFRVVSDEEYTVTFDVNGGNGSNTARTVNAGNMVTAVGLPLRDGYACIGWGTSASATEAVYQPGDSITVTEDMRLYAVWEKVTVTIVAGANSGWWTLDNLGTLRISYQGKLQTAPWNNYRSQIKTVIIEEGVTYISGACFAFCENLQKIVIPSTVKEITYIDSMYNHGSLIYEGYGAFQSCDLITSIGPIGSGCDYEYGWTTEIPENAFAGLVNINKFIVPGTIAVIPEYILADSLENFTTAGPIGSGCDYEFGWKTEIPADAFRGMGKVNKKMSISLPNTITKIGNEAFAYTGITKLELPSSLREIEYRAFSNSDLISIKIPKGVTALNGGLFRECKQLTNVELPDGLTYIGTSAFADCISLSNIDIPDSVSEIGSSAFHGCIRLETFEVPRGLTELESGVLGNCTGLKTLIIPETLTKLSQYAYTDSTNITDIYYGGSADQWYALKGYSNAYNGVHVHCAKTAKGSINSNLRWEITPDNTLIISGKGSMTEREFSLVQIYGWILPIKTIVVKSGVTTIPWQAFNGFTEVTKISIASTVEIIETNAFASCDKITTAGPIGSGCDYEFGWTDGVVGAAFTGMDGLTKLYIPETMTRVGYVDCPGLTTAGPIGSDCNIEFGWTDEIPDSAFESCRSVKKIILPDTVTKIGNRAFSGCSALTDVLLPDSLTVIGEYLFQNCSSLTEITIPDSVSKIGFAAFRGCTGLTSLEIPDSVTSIRAYAFQNCSGLTKLVIPASVKSFENNIYSGCTGLVTAGPIGSGCNIEFGWKDEIPTFSFDGLESLKEVTFYGGREDHPIQKIGYAAFSDCSALESIELPDTVTFVSGFAFAKCTALKSITLPSSVQSIASNAFEGCTALNSVRLEGNVFNLQPYIFRNCTGLQEIFLPKSIEFIADEVFKGCDALTDVYYTGTEAEWETLLNNTFEGNEPLFREELRVHCNWNMFEEVTIASGTCGDSAAWTLSNQGHLHITGTGYVAEAPWMDSYVDQIKKLTIDEGVTGLCVNAFRDCYKLKKVHMPASMQSYPSGMFAYCNRITSAGPIGSGCDFEYGWTKAIPENAFAFLPGLKKVMWHEDLGAIGAKAFAGCPLISLVIPEGVKTIHSEAFAACDQLRRLSVPRGLNVVGEGAFFGCTSLEEVFIMSASVAIGKDAFRNCAALEAVYYALSGAAVKGIDLQSGNEALSDAEVVCYDWQNSMVAGAIMKRNGVWHNIMTQQQTLSVESYEMVDIRIVPGMDARYAEAAVFRLDQNDQCVLRNRSGKFEDIAYRDYLVENGTVYALIQDDFGKTIDRLDLKLRLRDGYVITYVYWDFPNGSQKIVSETYISSDRIEEPEKPESDDYPKSGYRFRGWYASENHTGIEFFSDWNETKRNTMAQDITLYAKWVPATLNVFEDIWTITNSPIWFDVDYDPTTKKIKAKYEISNSDYNKLLESVDNDGKEAIADLKDRTWDGSCFGMSSVVVLAKEGYIDIGDFPGRNPATGKDNVIYNNVFEALISGNEKKNKDVDNIESMINFYHLRQKATAINTPLWKFDDENESANIEKILSKMKQADGPVVLTIRLRYTDGTYSSHSVVAYDLVGAGEYYTFLIYDCSVGSDVFKVEILKENGQFITSCDEWEAAWNRGKALQEIFLGSALSAEDLLKLPILEAPKTLNRAASAVQEQNVGFYLLETSYGSFTITDGITSAVITNGEVTSGDMEIVSYGMVGVPAAYSFELPALTGEKTYTLKQTGAGSMQTTLRYSDPKDGFYFRQSAQMPGIVSFTANGVISTCYDSSVSQSVSMTLNTVETPWYTIAVEGSSPGLKLASDGEAVSILSDSDTEISITATSDFNKATLSDVSVGQQAILVKEGENVSLVALKNGEAVATASFGHSVLFDSRLGTSVDALINVPSGSLIEEPADPSRIGYLFGGWYIDQEYTTLWNFDIDTVNADLVLYAGWSVDPSYMKSVTFRVPGKADQIVYLPVDSMIPISYAPSGPGGEELVWYSDQRYMEQWDFEEDRLKEDQILYGKSAICTIQFVTGTDQALENVEVHIGLAMFMPDELKRDGWTFCGWYRDEALEEQWDLCAPVMEDMTLYAKWLPNELDENGADTGISIEILKENSYIYTGKAIKPEIIVRDGGRILAQGVDYTVTYKNNTNACSRDDVSVKANKLPQIIIQGKGNYKSTKKITKYFTIYQADMKQLQVSLPTFVAVKSRDKLQKVKVSVSNGAVKVSSGNYTVCYYKEIGLNESVSGITSAGQYYITLEAKKSGDIYSGNFRGVTDPILVEAVSANQLLSSAKITVQKTVNAVRELPDEKQAIALLISKVTVNKMNYLTDEENLAAFMERFEVTAVDADGTGVAQNELGRILMNTGKKTICIRAKAGNPEDFVGEKTAVVTVKGIALSKKLFTVSFAPAGEKVNLKTQFNGAVQVPTVFTELEEGTDYTVSYKKGKTVLTEASVRDAGSYSLVITGKGRYSGSLSYNFSITKADLLKAYAAGELRIHTTGRATYTPLGAKPSLSVSYTGAGGTYVALKEGVDYTLSFSGNKTVTENAAMTLKGKGNFSGSLNKVKAPELVYSVVQKSLSASDISVMVTGLTVKKGIVTGAKFAVYHAGKKVASSQYKAELTDGNTSVILKISGTNKLYTGSRSVEISKYLTKTTDSKNVKLSLPKNVRYYYTGSAIRPEINITDFWGYDISNGFTITYGDNTKVGSGTVTITGRPEMGYCGSKTLKFTILPRWTMWIFG